MNASTDWSAFAVAASGSLYDGIQRPHGAPYDGEIDIDTSFNELRGNDAARLSVMQKATNVMDDGKPMGWAHSG